jgi:hypothetical protein
LFGFNFPFFERGMFICYFQKIVVKVFILRTYIRIWVNIPVYIIKIT